MQHVHHLGKAHRINRALSVAAMILDDLQNPRPLPFPGLRVRVAQHGFADLKRAAQAREAGAGGATQIVRGPMVYRGGVAGLARGKQTVTAGSDMAQLAPMVDQVETRVGKVPEQWLVDGGFPAHESTPWPARPSSMPILDARARTRSVGMVTTLRNVNFLLSNEKCLMK